MPHKEFDFFIAEPHSTDVRRCLVGGVPCSVTRNVFGPTGFVTAIAGLFRVHDEWICPLTDEPWHARALQLVIARRPQANGLRRSFGTRQTIR
jgi:hypothetical protein